MLRKAVPYRVPDWAAQVLKNPPTAGRLQLANLPTPLHQLDTQNSSLLQILHDLNIQLYIKRDDMTGGPELGGNKIRKLEFLLAQALEDGKNCVVTIGGEQSNHCRATACASRMLGLEPHLILRTRQTSIGLTGNLLFGRMVGSHVYTVTPGEYGRFGQAQLIQQVADLLEAKGQKPYVIPVGGSNALGTWGYLQGVDELMTQRQDTNTSFDHVVFATGSGGTMTGIALGLHLYCQHHNLATPTCHALGVCDSPEYFYETLQQIATDLGLTEELSFPNICTVHDGKGIGYARNTPDEMAWMEQFAIQTGMVLDPVYTGKALFYFITQVLAKDPESFRGKNVLFWHTGGALGMYDRDQELAKSLQETSPVTKLDVYGTLDKS